MVSFRKKKYKKTIRFLKTSEKKTKTNDLQIVRTIMIVHEWVSLLFHWTNEFSERLKTLFFYFSLKIQFNWTSDFTERKFS